MRLPSFNLILVLAVGLGWGLLAPANKELYAGEPSVFNGLTVTMARALWALPPFLIGLAVTWRMNPPRLDARGWSCVIGAGAVFGLGVSTLFALASQRTPVAHMSFLFGMSPVTTTAVAALVFRTRLDQRGRLALGLGVLGVSLLALTQHGNATAMVGDLMMVGWLAAFGSYACLLRAVGPGISAGTLMCLVGSISMGVLLIPGFVMGYGAAAFHVADTPSMGWSFFGEIVLGSTLLAQTAYAAAVRRMGVALATIGGKYTALAVGVACSLIGREAWSPLTAASGAIFCAALAVTFVPVPGFLRPVQAPERSLAAVEPVRTLDWSDPFDGLVAPTLAAPAAPQAEREVVAV